MRVNDGLAGLINWVLVLDMVVVGLVEIRLDGPDLFNYCAQIDWTVQIKLLYIPILTMHYS